MYEAQRDQLSNQAFNIDQTSFAIETVKNTQITVSAMKSAAKTLKSEQKKINLSELEDMQDDMEGFEIRILHKNCCNYFKLFFRKKKNNLKDMLEDVGEISDILGRSYGMPDGIDEEDLDAELACLEDELESEDVEESTAVQSNAVSNTPFRENYVKSLPSQPTGAPQLQNQQTNNQHENAANTVPSYLI
jgi:charged multivesicular body protein 5